MKSVYNLYRIKLSIDNKDKLIGTDPNYKCQPRTSKFIFIRDIKSLIYHQPLEKSLIGCVILKHRVTIWSKYQSFSVDYNSTHFKYNAELFVINNLTKWLKINK